MDFNIPKIDNLAMTTFRISTTILFHYFISILIYSYRIDYKE